MPDQERLSEQEIEAYRKLAWQESGIPSTPVHGTDLRILLGHIDSLARQLTEAEREKDEERQWRERLQVSEEREHDKAERYREALELIVSTTASEYAKEIARQALDTGDGQSVAPESAPKSGSGEEAGGG